MVAIGRIGAVGRLGLSGLSGGVTAWTPADLFSPTSQGGWYDASDLSTMFVEDTGLTPATPGSQVGLMLDKSQGLAATESNPDPTISDTANYNVVSPGATVSIATGRITYAGADSNNYAAVSTAINNTIAQNQYHRVTIRVENYVSGTLRARLRTGSLVSFTPQNGDNVIWVRAGTGSLSNIAGATGSEATLDIVGWWIEEIAGNHIYQSSSAARPVLEQDGNGKKHLSYDGLDDILTGLKPITLNAANHFIGGAVYRDTETTGGFGGVLFSTAGHSSRSVATQDRMGARLRDAADYADAGMEVGLSPEETQLVLDSYVSNGTNIDCFVNGTQNGEPGIKDTPVNASGLLVNLGNVAFDGRIYGAVFVDADITASRTRLRQYLASLNGATLS